MKRMGLVERINNNITDYNIPDELCINWDQTISNYVPVSSWTMHEKGPSQVPMAQLDDKRQMTVLMPCTKSGTLLPPQLLYQGKTDACHPDYDFPADWDIWHTESHWSNVSSMERYVNKIIVPYIVRDDMELPLRQRALCIFDIYKAHQAEELRVLLQKHNIQIVYVPASCTDKLKPLDVSVNGLFKQSMKSMFEDWYADEVSNQFQNNTDMILSLVKPIHAKWLVKTIQKISTEKLANETRMGSGRHK